MLFTALAITAIVLYILDYKVPAMLIFFFFLTQGFNLVPPPTEAEARGMLFYKGSDFATIILAGILVIDCFFVRNFLKPDGFVKCLMVFFAFLVFCILYNKAVLGIGWSEIIRTARFQFFWTAFFVFRTISKDSLERLMKILLVITAITSALFVLQIFIGTNILVETNSADIRILGVNLIRFYNQPDMLHFFVVMAIFFNPFSGLKKWITTGLLVAAYFGAFHRSHIGAFVVVLFLGYVLQLPRLQRVKILTGLSVILLFVVVFVGYRFVNSRTFVDVKAVITGNVLDADIDLEDLAESTFTFRIAHLLERNQYLLDNPRAMLAGAGLMTEDSRLTYSLFDFDIGHVEAMTGETTQLDTGDISYSILLIRFGYLGTALYMMLFIHLAVFFYRKRNRPYGLFSFLFYILSFFISFFSSNLEQPVTMILPFLSYHYILKYEETVLV
jgi:hypothetical protein